MPRPRGILQYIAANELTHRQLAPPPDLANWVQHYWTVSWDLEYGTPRLQQTLPHPNVHLVIERGSATIWGVHTRRWARTLEGRASAFGIKFRPGAFRPFLGRPVSSITNISMEIETIFGQAARGLDHVIACDDDVAAARVASDFLRSELRPIDPLAMLAGRIADSIEDDLELRSADQLAKRFDMSLRSLQRLFNDYVGVGPKWVINRYRLLEAVARVQAGQEVCWASLAQNLGYFDQAHFISDFRNHIGKTPADYGRSALPHATRHIPSTEE